MKKIVSLIAVLFSLLFVTTGCMKLNMNLEVTSQDTVNGEIIFAMSDAALEAVKAAGGNDNALNTKNLFKGAKFNVESAEYKDGTFTGTKYTFKDAPLEQFDNGEGTELSIRRLGDTIKVSGTLNLTGGYTQAQIDEMASSPATADYFKDFDVKVSIVLPGSITSTNGTTEGQKITWSGQLGKSIELQAESNSTKFEPLPWIIAGSAALIVAIAATGFFLLRKKKPADEH